jgi:hypothetical protein
MVCALGETPPMIWELLRVPLMGNSGILGYMFVIFCNIYAEVYKL